MSSPSSIRDSNPQPLECESLPITTRPGLPPFMLNLYLPKVDRFLVYFLKKLFCRKSRFHKHFKLKEVCSDVCTCTKV